MHRISLAMLSFLALFIALPRVFGQFSNDTPECIINCYNIQFAKAAAGDYAPLETGQLLSLCNSNPWMADLSTMWSNECTAAEVSVGTASWNAACAYSASTSCKSFFSSASPSVRVDEETLKPTAVMAASLSSSFSTELAAHPTLAIMAVADSAPTATGTISSSPFVSPGTASKSPSASKSVAVVVGAVSLAGMGFVML